MCIVSTWQRTHFLNVSNRQEGREREGNGIRKKEGGWVVHGGEGGAERIDIEPINFFT